MTRPRLLSQEKQDMMMRFAPSSRARARSLKEVLAAVVPSPEHDRDDDDRKAQCSVCGHERCEVLNDVCDVCVTRAFCSGR